MNEQQLAAVEAHGEVFVSAGAGTGKTRVLVERFARAVCDDGLDVAVGARDHVHAQGRRRAALAHPRGARCARPVRPRATTRRRVGLDDPRLLRPPPARASVRGRDRPALPRARRGAGRGTARRGIRARARGVLRDARARPAAGSLATYGSNRLRQDPHQRLRDSCARPDVRSSSSLGSEPDLGEALAALREAAQCLVDDTQATENQRAAARAALDLPAAPERLVDLKALRARGPRAASYKEALGRVEPTALAVVARRDRVLLQELLALFAD